MCSVVPLAETHVTTGYSNTCSARISLLLFHLFIGSVLSEPLLLLLEFPHQASDHQWSVGQLWCWKRKPWRYENGHLHMKTQCRTRHSISVIGKGSASGGLQESQSSWALYPTSWSKSTLELLKQQETCILFNWYPSQTSAQTRCCAMTFKEMHI